MPNVIHDPVKHRFLLKIEGEEAHLIYRIEGNNQVNFTSTFVPDAFRGKGYGRQLVDTGLAWAREQGYGIKTDCWYVQRILDRGG